MFDKKRLLINCDVCDARKIKEEDYKDYQEIILNADVLLVSNHSRSILNRLPMVANVDDTLELADDADVNLQTFNGNYEITKAAGALKQTVLCLNGSLLIKPDAREILKNYIKIYVNGSVKYPQSLEGCLPDISVNGHMGSYPDACTILDSRLVLDAYFPLRAKENGSYYVEDEVILTEEAVDVAMLTEKKVQFITKHFIVSENKVRESIALVDETVKLTVIPDGMQTVCEDVHLEENLLEKYGDRIFVYGDLTITEDSMQAMKKLKELIVTGDVYIKKSCMESFEALHAKYKGLKPLRRELKNKMSVTVDANVLKNSPDGLLVKNVAKLEIKEDVAVQGILDLLLVENCQTIHCTPEQKSSVELISSNVATVVTDEEEPDAEGSGGIFSQIKQGIGFLKDSKIINADNYSL